MTTYIGLDVHKNFTQAVAMNEQGEILLEREMASDSKELKRFVERLGDTSLEAALESSGCYLPTYQCLEELGIKTKLVNTLKTKLRAESVIKTDKIDARTIANLLRTNYLATCYVPKPEVRDLRELTRHRKELGKQSTRYKNRVQAIMLKHGFRHPFTDLFGKAGTLFLKQLPVSPIEKHRLSSYMALIEQLQQQKKCTEEQIEIAAKANKQAMLLTTMPGISYYSGLMIAAEIADIHRFRGEKQLACYAGLVPITRSSGGKTWQGHVIKASNKNLKWIAGQCTMVHIRCCPNSAISKLYRRLEKKRGKQKAIVAATRKMITIVYYLLKRNQPYKER